MSDTVSVDIGGWLDAGWALGYRLRYSKKANPRTAQTRLTLGWIRDKRGGPEAVVTVDDAFLRYAEALPDILNRMCRQILGEDITRNIDKVFVRLADDGQVGRSAARFAGGPNDGDERTVPCDPSGWPLPLFRIPTSAVTTFVIGAEPDPFVPIAIAEYERGLIDPDTGVWRYGFRSG